MAYRASHTAREAICMEAVPTENGGACLVNEVFVVLLLEDLLLLLRVPHPPQIHHGDVDRVPHTADLLILQLWPHVQVGVAL